MSLIIGWTRHQCDASDWQDIDSRVARSDLEKFVWHGSIRDEYKLYLNTLLLEIREKFIAIKTLGFWNSLQNESRWWKQPCSFKTELDRLWNYIICSRRQWPRGSFWFLTWISMWLLHLLKDQKEEMCFDLYPYKELEY